MRSNPFPAIVIHIAVSIGLSFSMLQVVLDGPSALVSGWQQNFALLRRGLGDPALLYYTLVVSAALLAVPAITGLLDGREKRRAGIRAASALGIGLLVLLVYGLLVHAPHALGLAPRLTVMANMGIRFTSLIFVLIWVVINVPFAVFAGWITDRFYRRG